MKNAILRVLCVAAILIAVAYMTQSAVNWVGCKEFVQKVPSPDGRYWYSLFWDHAGFGDPSWHVYQVPSAVDVESMCVERGTDDSALFANYSEAGEDCEDAGIEVLRGKYLVMRRGGLFHSLYDISQGRLLVNEWSPFGAYMNSAETDSSDRTISNEVRIQRIHAWTAAHLDQPIRQILEKEPEGR